MGKPEGELLESDGELEPVEEPERDWRYWAKLLSRDLYEPEPVEPQEVSERPRTAEESQDSDEFEQPQESSERPQAAEESQDSDSSDSDSSSSDSSDFDQPPEPE